MMPERGIDLDRIASDRYKRYANREQNDPTFRDPGERRIPMAEYGEDDDDEENDDPDFHNR
jgi:hypothetical protein